MGAAQARHDEGDVFPDQTHYRGGDVLAPILAELPQLAEVRRRDFAGKADFPHASAAVDIAHREIHGLALSCPSQAHQGLEVFFSEESSTEAEQSASAEGCPPHPFVSGAVQTQNGSPGAQGDEQEWPARLTGLLQKVSRASIPGSKFFDVNRFLSKILAQRVSTGAG